MALNGALAARPGYARAYANLGDADNCRRAIANAEDLFPGDEAGPGRGAGRVVAGHTAFHLVGDETGQACPRPTDDPAWIGFFTEAELNGENGHSYRDLAYRFPALAGHADKTIGRAVELFSGDDAHLRSRALNVIGMATVRLQQREPEAAVGFVHTAADLAQRLRSKRVEDRLRATAAAIVARYPDVRSAREANELVGALLPVTV